MRQRTVIALICCFLGFIHAQETPGYFQAIEGLSESANPQKDWKESFLYRIPRGNSFVFYKISLTSLLYESKIVFLWPADLSDQEKINTPFFSLESGEPKPVSQILLNDNLILSDNDQLAIRIQGRIQPLTKIAPSPGILYVKGSEEVQFQPVYSSKQAEALLSLPVFIYTRKADPKMGIFRRKGYYSQLSTFRSSPGSYAERNVVLKSYPRLALKEGNYAVQLEKYNTPAEKLKAVEDNISAVLDDMKRDSVLVNEYRRTILEGASFFPAQNEFGSKSEYEMALQAYENEKKRLLEEALQLSRVNEIKTQKVSQYSILLTLKENIQNSSQRERELLEQNPVAILVEDRFAGRFFLGGGVSLGRNLPEYAVDPGPSGTWAGFMNVSWYWNVKSHLLIVPRLEGMFSRWKYHQEISDVSEQQWYGAALYLAVPLVFGVSADKNGIEGMSLLLRAGGVAGFSMESIVREGEPKSYNAVSGGFGVGVEFFFTSLPVGVHAEYQYHHIGYGDLRAGLSIPLWFISPVGVDQ